MSYSPSSVLRPQDEGLCSLSLTGFACKWDQIFFFYLCDWVPRIMKGKEMSPKHQTGWAPLSAWGGPARRSGFRGPSSGASLTPAS